MPVLSSFSSVTESLIFIILGVMLVNEQGLYWTDWHPLFSVYAVLLCIIARVLGNFQLYSFQLTILSMLN